jgi:hypothetical protein
MKVVGVRFTVHHTRTTPQGIITISATMVLLRVWRCVVGFGLRQAGGATHTMGDGVKLRCCSGFWAAWIISTID